MATPGNVLRSDPLIRFVCRRHTTPDPVGPTVTITDGSWALCAGHGMVDHDWLEIEATRRESLET
jgi:hypothetical protein